MKDRSETLETDHSVSHLRPVTLPLIYMSVVEYTFLGIQNSYNMPSHVGTSEQKQAVLERGNTRQGLREIVPESHTVSGATLDVKTFIEHVPPYRAAWPVGSSVTDVSQKGFTVCLAAMCLSGNLATVTH